MLAGLSWDMRARARVWGCGLLWSACAGAPAEPAVENTPADPPPVRVLVTAFHDWEDLGEPANIWRCRDNPSCRLLVGAAVDQRPTTFSGPLVERLRAPGATSADRPIEWTFTTMPVTWGAFDALADYTSHDVVVHLGLGVYDRFDVLQLEDGAFNRRRGADAAGRELDEPIVPEDPAVVGAPPATPVQARVAALAGRTFGAYTVTVAAARESNSYLCNETHFRALKSLAAARAAGSRLERVHFLHLPYPREGDYASLADGVAGVLLALVE
jgi:hypothetical protein